MPRRPVPSLYPVASSSLNQGYILSITPVDSASAHLVLTHPSPRLSIADAQTLQLVDVLGTENGHTSDVSAVCTGLEADGLGGASGEAGGVWSASKDATVIRWDERTRTPGQRIRAFARKPLPLMALAYSQRDNLLAAGTELVGSDAYIVYWDVRRPSEPLYTHSQTHSDDITHLSFLPSTRNIHLPSAAPSTTPLPPRLLLSASTDGLIALSDPRENDEDEACWAAEPLGGSVARAGWYAAGNAGGGKTRINVWARSDMDSVGAWAIEGGLEGAEVQMRSVGQWPTDMFHGVQVGQDGATQKAHAGATGHEASYTATSDYIVDVCPSLGISQAGVGLLALGDNSGNVTLMHHSSDHAKRQRRSSHSGEGLEAGPAAAADASTGHGLYRASAFLRSPPPALAVAHRDVVRALHFDVKTNALYTGSEDSVLCGWAMPVDDSGVIAVSCGNPNRDDDGGDGREGASDQDGDEDDTMDSDSGSERSSSGMSIGS